MINVIGDVGLVVGARSCCSTRPARSTTPASSPAPRRRSRRNDGTLVAACLLILVGAFAKSAQLPLHTWLPDAMEGPTPVSALIHAATMVTAGVYLIARMHPLFELAPTAADISAIIGTATLVFAATVALVVTDLKRVIAYSTISQIGYMVLGVSVAAYGAGLFHLMTHAFFKALLFMGAGSVIGAMAGRPGPRPHGRLPARRCRSPSSRSRSARWRWPAFPLMSGLLLEGRDPRLHDRARRRLRGARDRRLPGGAFLTAFYAFRMVFRVFCGEPVPEARELEERPRRPRRARPTR